MGGEPGKAHVGTPPFHARLSREDGPHGFRRLATSDRPPSRPSSSASRSKLAKFPTEKLRCFSKSFSPPLLLLLPWIVFFVEKGSWERAALVECLLLLVSVFFKFSEGIRERGESNNERVFSSRRKIVRRFFLLLETRRLSPPSNDRLT